LFKNDENKKVIHKLMHICG